MTYFTYDGNVYDSEDDLTQFIKDYVYDDYAYANDLNN